MRPDVAMAYRELREAHGRFKRIAEQIMASVDANMSREELADIAYAARESASLADENRKAWQMLTEKAQRTACILWLQDMTNAGEPIRTEHCTATPDVRVAVRVPSRKKDPERYARLMQWLGVPEALYTAPEGESPAVDLHYMGIVRTATDMLAEGKTLPPELNMGNTGQLYFLKIRGRKGVDETLPVDA